MPKPEKNKRAAEQRGSSIVTQWEQTDLQSVAIIIVLVAVFFHKILLGEAFFWEDFIYQNYPFRYFAATSLASGELPLWNPYTFNGMPFLADIQTTVLYLPCLLLTLFVSGGLLHFYWLELMIILHFVLAGVGMYYLAKSFNVRNIPSLFAAVAYMLSGYMIVHAIHQQNVTLVAWYPLIVLFFRKALDEQRWLYVFVCALTLGHSILAGYPQLSLYLYLFLGLYFLFELLSRFELTNLFSRAAFMMTMKAASIVVFSVALAAIQLLPSFELSDLSQRAQMTYEKSAEGSLAWSQLATMFYPKMFGSAGAKGYEYFGPGQYFYYWETCMYFGTLPLILALGSVVLIKRDKHVAFLVGVAAFSLLFALGDNFILYKLFFAFVPGFDKFRIPARMGIILAFCVSLLSAFSLHHIFFGEKSSVRRKLLRNIAFVVAGIGIVLYIVIVGGGFAGAIVNASFLQVQELTSKGIAPSLMILLVSAAFLVAVLMKNGLMRFAGVTLVAILFVDMFVFGGDQNNGDVNPREYFKRRSDMAEFFKKKGEKELFRINTRNAQGMLPGWDRNQGMIDRIFMLEGYTPLALQRAYAPVASNDQAYDLLNVKYKAVTDPQTGNLSLVEHTTRLPRAFFVYDVHLAKSHEELLSYIKSPRFNHRTTAVVEKELHVSHLSSATPSLWNVRITNYSNNEIKLDVSTSHDGLLVLSEIFYPGWKAYVDGAETEIFRTNYNLRSLFVSAGEHKIVVKFEPPSFRYGMWISAGALALCFGGIAFGRSKRNVEFAET